VDKVGGHPINAFPHRVGGHVRPRGRRRGRTNEGPGDFISLHRGAIAEPEEVGVKAPGYLTREEVIKERLVYLRRGRGTRQL